MNAVDAEMKNKQQSVLEFKAQHNQTVQAVTLDYRKQYLGVLEDKEQKQYRNIHGII